MKEGRKIDSEREHPGVVVNFPLVVKGVCTHVCLSTTRRSIDEPLQARFYRATPIAEGTTIRLRLSE